MKTSTTPRNVGQESPNQGECPECEGRLVRDETHGELACDDCGLIAESDCVDHGPEWRSFLDDDTHEASRVGAPVTNLLHDKGLSSVIGADTTDANGNALNARRKRQFSRLRTWDERFRTKDADERNLKQALAEIERMGSALGLPEHVRETASAVYRRALDADLLPGRSIEGVASASVYAAARQTSLPRSLREVAAVSRVERLRIQRSYSDLNTELGLDIEPADPRQYARRYVSDLDLDTEAEAIAEDLLDAAVEANCHSGKSPTTLAAGAVYAAATLTNQRVTQEAVAETADVSVIAIRNRYQALLEVYEGE